MADVSSTKRKGRRRSRSRTRMILGIVGVVAVVALVSMLAFGDRAESGIDVEIESAALRTVVQSVTASGVIEPEVQVVVSSEVSGEIVELRVEEGDRVSRGQVLARINPATLMAEREQASAQILSARASAASSKAQVLKLKADLDRIQKLHDKKLVTDQEFDNARSQVDISEAELQAAEYRVQQAQASLRQVQESINKTTIVAPISGIVSRLNVKLGEKVVGAIQMTGTELMTIADLSVIESVVDVVETDVIGISVGDEATVVVDALPNETFHAVVSSIANSPKVQGIGSQDQLTNFEVRLRFLDPDVKFRPGMTATATITTARKERVVTVPIQAVTTRKDSAETVVDEGTDEYSDRRLDRSREPQAVRKVVFLVDGTTVIQREVTTGVRDDMYVEITSGLAAGDTIVSGSYSVVNRELRNGTTIARPTRENVGNETMEQSDG